MTSRMDIWRAAKLLVDQRGTDAPIRAAQRADALLAAGDIEGRYRGKSGPGFVACDLRSLTDAVEEVVDERAGLLIEAAIDCDRARRFTAFDAAAE